MKVRRAGVLVAVALGCTPPAFAHDVTSGLSALNKLCRSTIERGDYEEAQRICKRINFDAEKMAPGSKQHIESVLNMGDIKARVENYVDADSWYQAALPLIEKANGPDSAEAARVISSLVEFKVRRGKYLDAVALAKRVLVIREKTSGPNTLSTSIARARYADLLSQSSQYLDAEAQYKRSIAVLEHAGKANAETYARAVQRLGEMYERRAQYKQAEQQYRRLVEIIERYALSYRLLAGALDRVGYVCEQQDRPAEAATFYRRALATLKGTKAAPEVVARIQAQLSAVEAAPAQASAAAPEPRGSR